MQLARVIACGVVGMLASTIASGIAPAVADDRAEVSTTLFTEKRDGGKGGLTVISPQADFGIDLGRYVSMSVAYTADAVTGATSTVYQSDAVTGATTFSDFRQEGTFSFGFHGKRSRLDISGTFGTERDYLTHQIGASGSVDLPGRNTTVGLAYSHSADQVCDKDNTMVAPLQAQALIGSDACDKSSGFWGKNNAMAGTVWKDLSIDTAQVTITQNISPTLTGQLAIYGQVLDGFQSNPYRRVRVGGAAPQEHIPEVRDRWSVSLRLNRYLPKLHSAAHFDARFYDDTWHVLGGDVELGYSQYLGQSLLLRIHARVYQQSAAAFFKDAFFYETQSTAGEYYTGDRELSPVRSAMVGGKLTLISLGGEKKVIGIFDKLQFNIKGDVLFLDQLAADDLTNNPAGIGKQFLYGNSFLDAVILQLGLLGNY